MELDGLFLMLAGLHPAIPDVLMILGSIVVVAQAFEFPFLEKAKSIPLVGKIFKGLSKFSIFQRKPVEKK